jgi:hypothetical protein
MRVSAKAFLPGCAFLLAAWPAVASDESAGTPIASAAPGAVMNCPGITSIPMTADATQALPMRLLRMLSCDESVTILSDNDGYTVRVRTADGKEGYVARMYLKMGDSPRSMTGQQPASATAVNNVVRWEAGAPGCDQFLSKGHAVESATANGVTVQVSLEDSGWKLRATVAIYNKGEETAEVLPALITLAELQPNMRALLAQDPEKLTRVVNHQVLLTYVNAQPSPSAVTYHGQNAATAETATYRPPTPDYFGEHVVQASASNRTAIVPSAAELRSLALKHTKLASGQKTVGVIWFERDGTARELSLRVPVGDLVFDFPLSFQQKH